MSANEIEAVRLFGVYTARRFQIWSLAGNGRAAVRAHIMSALTGKRTPQAKSGVNALREGFLKLADIQPTCSADGDARLVTWCKSIELKHGWGADVNYGRK